jgi:hypothetical protein
MKDISRVDENAAGVAPSEGDTEEEEESQSLAADLSFSFLHTGVDAPSAANGEASRARVDGQQDALPQPEWVDDADLWQIVLEFIAKKHVWLDDQSALECAAASCRKNFATTGERKHHCRMCGLIFCNACAPTLKDPLDPKSPSIKVLAKPSSVTAAIWGTILSMTVGSVVADRLCCKCLKIYEALDSKTIGVKLAESMDRALFRECQYRMPYHALTTDEIDYLRRDLSLFHGHSKYTVQVQLP